MDKRVNVEARSKYGTTPLLLAAEGDRERDTTAVLQLLLQRGADIKAKGRLGEMVFEVALRGRDANMKLSYSSKQEIDLPAPDDFILKALREALHVVTERSNIDMVRLLVEKGDDTEAKDKWQQGNYRSGLSCVCARWARKGIRWTPRLLRLRAQDQP